MTKHGRSSPAKSNRKKQVPGAAGRKRQPAGRKRQPPQVRSRQLFSFWGKVMRWGVQLDSVSRDGRTAETHWPELGNEPGVKKDLKGLDWNPRMGAEVKGRSGPRLTGYGDTESLTLDPVSSRLEWGWACPWARRGVSPQCQCSAPLHLFSVTLCS